MGRRPRRSAVGEVLPMELTVEQVGGLRVVRALGGWSAGGGPRRAGWKESRGAGDPRAAATACCPSPAAVLAHATPQPQPNPTRAPHAGLPLPYARRHADQPLPRRSRRRVPPHRGAPAGARSLGAQGGAEGFHRPFSAASEGSVLQPLQSRQLLPSFLRALCHRPPPHTHTQGLKTLLTDSEDASFLANVLMDQVWGPGGGGGGWGASGGGASWNGPAWRPEQ
jgi:hypothetical protein